MVRINVDGTIMFDPRLDLLAKEMRITKNETLGALLRVWFACYGRRSPELTFDEIDSASDLAGYAAALVNVGFADLCEGYPEGSLKGRTKARLRGVDKRIEYLRRAEDFGRTGGLMSGKVRQTQRNDSRSKGASRVPSTPPQGVANLLSLSPALSLSQNPPTPLCEPSQSAASRPADEDQKPIKKSASREEKITETRRSFTPPCPKCGKPAFPPNVVDQGRVYHMACLYPKAEGDQ